MVSRAAVVLAGAVLGLGIGVAVTLLSDDVYEARTVLAVSAAADARVPASRSRRLPADVLAERYAELLDERSFLAGLAPRVAGGRFGADEVAARVETRHASGSALVTVTAEGGSRSEAKAIAGEVAGALVALVRQLSRQYREPAAHEQARSVRIASAAYAPSEPERPDRVHDLAGGLLLGVVVGLGATVLGRREHEPADAARPRVALDGPDPGSVVAGTVPFTFRAQPGAAPIAALELLVSDGGAGWRLSDRFDAWPVEAEWDSTTVVDGVYWLSAVVRDREGRAAATAPLPLVVRNRPEPGL